MRSAFASEITALAAADDRIVLLSGDIGNRMFDDFKSKFPDRFYNCGIAEQSMISLGAGLAMCGLRPVAYTIAPFVTYRCIEQIRVDLCYHELPMVLIGVGAGLGYAELGATHHSCEDIAMLRTLPGMSVICPGDAHEVRAGLRGALALSGPAYLRIGKKGEPLVHQSLPVDFRIGRALTVRDGSDVCLLSTGNTLPLAVEASEQLTRRGLSAAVVSCHTVKPLDTEFLKQAFQRFRVLVTLEEHSVIGGFGAAVAEWLADREPARGMLLRVALPDAFPHEAGDQEHARQAGGLSVESITRRVWIAFMACDTTKQKSTIASSSI